MRLSAVRCADNGGFLVVNGEAEVSVPVTGKEEVIYNRTLLGVCGWDKVIEKSSF